MPEENSSGKTAFSPRYFIISRSEPNYDLIKKQLLDSPRVPAGSSCYFVPADRGCVCRIRAGNGTVLFCGIPDPMKKGIQDREIREAMTRPSCATPLPGYYHLTPAIEEKIQATRQLQGTILPHLPFLILPS